MSRAAKQPRSATGRLRSQPAPPSFAPPGDDRSHRRLSRMLLRLKRASANWQAPVLSLIAAERGDPFLVLVGCLLSLRTRDQVTAQVSARLFARARTPQEILACGASELEKLLRPVGFYRNKTKVLIELSRALIARHGGRVPDRLEALLALNGVGLKTANLVLSEGFGKPAICVDTHVHRISNRWGLVQTRTPEQTEARLREILPRRFWRGYNRLLVAFGQTLCQPRSPLCSRCPVARDCPRLGVAHSR